MTKPLRTIALALISVAISLPFAAAASDAAVTPQETATYEKVKPILERNCSLCHAPKPAMPFYAKAPDGVTFNSAQELARYAARVIVVATQTDQMPPGNMTGMTEAERETLAAALQAQWPTAR